MEKYPTQLTREQQLQIALESALLTLERKDIKVGPKIAIVKRTLRNALSQ
jgi:hypothetical protein